MPEYYIKSHRRLTGKLTLSALINPRRFKYCDMFNHLEMYIALPDEHLVTTR